MAAGLSGCDPRRGYRQEDEGCWVQGQGAYCKELNVLRAFGSWESRVSHRFWAIKPRMIVASPEPYHTELHGLTCHDIRSIRLVSSWRWPKMAGHHSLLSKATSAILMSCHVLLVCRKLSSHSPESPAEAFPTTYRTISSITSTPLHCIKPVPSTWRETLGRPTTDRT